MVKGKSRSGFRWLTAAVAILMVMGFAIGCSKGNNESAGTASDTPATTSSADNNDATATNAASPDAPKEIVTIKSIYPGDKPKGLDPVLAKINEKLAADIGVKLELSWAPWDQYYNKVVLSVAAGEDVDFIWSGSSSLSQYAAQKIIAPLDEAMAAYGKPIYDNIDSKLFDTMKLDGKLMGIPSTGNSPLTDVYHSIVYREDLRQKYNLPRPDSIENLEAYLKTIKENEKEMDPITSNSAAYIIMKKFGPEDFLGGTGSSVGYKINDDRSITLMPVQDMTSLNEANKKAREWFQAGYIPKDILNIGDVNSRLLAGATAMTNGAALTASEQQGTMSANVPGAILDNQPFFGDKKYIANNGGNALYLTSVSKHADKVVQFWSWVFSSQENFDLYNYGIEGVNYELKDNRVAFLDDGYTAFPGWMFKNMNFLRFPAGISDEYIDSMKKWDEGAEISPLMGFTFNPENVTTELAQVNSVWNAYSKTLESGIVDPEKLMPEFVDKIKAAGQDKILQEAQKQIDAFLAAQP